MYKYIYLSAHSESLALIVELYKYNVILKWNKKKSNVNLNMYRIKKKGNFKNCMKVYYYISTLTTTNDYFYLHNDFYVDLIKLII